MRTSEARKLAFRLAVEMYEQAEGQLLFTPFVVAEQAARFGVTDVAAAEAVKNYLISAGVMESMGIGAEQLQFTPAGVSWIEASFDEPKAAHGPFPPMSVVIGDIGSGAQVAIGSGSTFQQSATTGASADELGELVRLVQAASQEWGADKRQEAGGAQAALEGEARAERPDFGLMSAAAAKVAKVAEAAMGGVATQGMLAYLRGNGWLPPAG